MAVEFLYSKAPLIEVIAEIRWSMIPLGSIPGAAVDPHFGPLSDQFLLAARKGGYAHVEQLVPSEVPTEMLAGKPVFRCRRAPDKWPLYQLGPGMFSCNIVPRYDGWSAFRAVLEQGIQWLIDSFPVPIKFVKFIGLDLRYIDGFTKELGLTTYSDFLRNDLGVSLALPREKFPEGVLMDRMEVAAEAKIPLSTPKGSSLILKFSPGLKAGQPALIFEFRVASSNPPVVTGVSDLQGWMDAAHEIAHQTFDAVVSDGLKERMGPKVPVR